MAVAHRINVVKTTRHGMTDIIGGFGPNLSAPEGLEPPLPGRMIDRVKTLRVQPQACYRYTIEPRC